MATTLQYGRERAHLGRSLLNFMRITRDAHAPELTLGRFVVHRDRGFRWACLRASDGP